MEAIHTCLTAISDMYIMAPTVVDTLRKKANTSLN